MNCKDEGKNYTMAVMQATLYGKGCCFERRKSAKRKRTAKERICKTHFVAKMRILRWMSCRT